MLVWPMGHMGCVNRLCRARVPGGTAKLRDVGGLRVRPDGHVGQAWAA